MKSLIEYCDLVPHKVTLTFNEQGETKYKTLIGGLISIFFIIIIIIYCFFLFIRLFYRRDISVVHSTQINPYVNLTDSHKLPFLLRLTDTNSNPYQEDEKMYYITASIWYGGSNNTSLAYHAPQFSDSLNVSKCDINKHFTDEYKKYFFGINNLSSFYCLEPRNYSQTIYGLYGNNHPFSYYSLTFRYCKNTTENNNSCYSVEESKNKMGDSFYLDLIFIDYTLDSKKEKDIKELYIRKERYELSTILYKRIWLYLENIKYIIDTGYILSRKKIEYFHRYNSMRADFNLLEGEQYFATLTILNEVTTSIYNQEYKKIQDYLAIIGGLINSIRVIALLLNYSNSKNSYYLKLIQDFIIDNQTLSENVKKKKNQNNFYNTSINSRPNRIVQSSENTEKTKVGMLSINFEPKNNLQFINSTIPSKQHIGFSLIKKNKNVNVYKKILNSRLSIINILKKLEKINLYSDFYKNDVSKEYGIKKLNSMKANNYFMNNNSHKNDENTNMINMEK